MKKIFLVTLCCITLTLSVPAQIVEGRISRPKGENNESIAPIHTKSVEAEPSQYGKLMIYQSPQVEKLIKRHIAYNQKNNTIEGFRIRIYRDNRSNSRKRSQEIVEEFTEQFPNMPCYRTYDNPYFKVAVGDFRTKDDALRFFNRVKKNFPRAFIISEEINLPSLTADIYKENNVDSIRWVRQKQEQLLQQQIQQ